MAKPRKRVCQPGSDGVCATHGRPLLEHGRRCAEGRESKRFDGRPRRGPVHGRAAAMAAGEDVKRHHRSLDSQAARAARLDEIEARIAKGERRPAIVADLAERLGLAARTIEMDVVEVDDRYRAEIARRFPQLVADLHGWWMEQLDATALGSRERTDVLKEITKMTPGGYAPQAVQVTGTVGVVAVEAQLETLLESLDDEGLRAFELVRERLRAAAPVATLSPGLDVSEVADDAS